MESHRINKHVDTRVIERQDKSTNTVHCNKKRKNATKHKKYKMGQEFLPRSIQSSPDLLVLNEKLAFWGGFYTVGLLQVGTCMFTAQYK